MSLPNPENLLHDAAPADGHEAVGTGRMLEADVVIVGTGPGGAAVARVLSQGGLKVVLLEEGPAKSRFKPNQAHTMRYHMQEGGMIIAKGSAFLSIAAGRGVGGGTLINSALSFQPAADVLDGWAEALNDGGWGAQALSPIYDEMAALIGVSDTKPWFAGENNRLITRGIKALGLEGGLAPRSTPRCIGCGICNYGCPTGGKASMNLTLLPDAVSNGALIQADTMVTEILMENGRAVGVRGLARHPDTQEVVGPVTVHAPRVVLSAGAIGTPRLLWTAGLGDRLGPIGEGLHVHPGSAVFGLCDHEINLWRGATQGAYFHHPDLPGVLPHGFSAPPEVCLLAMDRVGTGLAEGLAMLPHLAGMVVMVSDKGVGRVRATADGRADIHYDFLQDDIDRIKLGMRETARVMFAGGAREVFVPVHGVGRHTNPESLYAALQPAEITDFSLYASHPMSTAAMGLDPKKSVVSPSGETHNIPGLYIADASVFPTSLGVNPQMTTLVIGTQIGRRMLGE